MNSDWIPFSAGQSIGKLGSENGHIVLDDEHVMGARMTMEKDGILAAFSITMGIYGAFVHTAFFSNEQQTIKMYDEYKDEHSFSPFP